MAAKVGDLVRFLNSVGGGRIVRIDGQIAYVDDDGFETPVMLRECVVVSSGDSFYKVESRKKEPEQPADPIIEAKTPERVLPPVEETPEGEKLNLVVAFEATEPLKLSSSSFDAFIVNDSNYTIYAVISTRSSDDEKWTLRFSGLLEPAIQEFAFELMHDELPDFDRISFHAVAFKEAAPFTRKQAIDVERRIDSTKFAKLHCFVENPYFDSKVIAIDIVRDDVVQKDFHVDAEDLQKGIMEKRRSEVNDSRRKVSRPARRKDAPLEVDLHAAALLDNLSGLSKADILNYQIDTFRKVMDENLKFPGKKIVFIHGKGEGVLRQALMKELNHRYKGHDVADASFREYGFGATQVTIRNIKRQP